MGEGHRIEIKQPETGPDAPPAPVKQEATSERPAWLPENFKSPEDLAKAFKDTQAELTRVKQGSKAPEPAKDQEAPKGEPKADEAAKAADDLTVEKAPVDEDPPEISLAEYEAEYDKNNGLSEESYKALRKQGFSKATVDEFIEGRLLARQSLASTAYEIAGGKDEFERVRGWLSSAEVSDEMREAFNKGLKGSKAERTMAIKAAVASFREIHGHEGRMISGQRSTESNSYASFYEQLADQRDPRYDTDPAFRARVEAKIRNSRY